jgi:hypothetical protein
VLLTAALDADDSLQWTLTPTGNEFTALTTNLVLPADAEEYGAHLFWQKFALEDTIRLGLLLVLLGLKTCPTCAPFSDFTMVNSSLF